MNTTDRNTINGLKAERAQIVVDTLKLRARQINLDRERAELALIIAHNDAQVNDCDQRIAGILNADYRSRLEKA